MKSFLRFLGRNKLYSLINVTGFVFSMAFVILTAAYTWHESTVDRFHEDAGRIYLLMNRTCDGWWEEGDAFPVAGWYKETFPDVEDVCAVSVCDSVLYGQFFYFLLISFVRGNPGNGIGRSLCRSGKREFCE